MKPTFSPPISLRSGSLMALSSHDAVVRHRGLAGEEHVRRGVAVTASRSPRRSSRPRRSRRAPARRPRTPSSVSFASPSRTSAIASGPTLRKMYMPMMRVSGQPSAPASVIGTTPASASVVGRVDEVIPGLGLFDAVLGEDLLVVPDALEVVLVRQRDHAAVDLLDGGRRGGEHVVPGAGVFEGGLQVADEAGRAEVAVGADERRAGDGVGGQRALAGQQRDLLDGVGLRDLLVLEREGLVLGLARALGQCGELLFEHGVLVRRHDGEAFRGRCRRRRRRSPPTSRCRCRRRRRRRPPAAAPRRVRYPAPRCGDGCCGCS